MVCKSYFEKTVKSILRCDEPEYVFSKPGFQCWKVYDPTNFYQAVEVTERKSSEQEYGYLKQMPWVSVKKPELHENSGINRPSTASEMRNKLNKEYILSLLSG